MVGEGEKSAKALVQLCMWQTLNGFFDSWVDEHYLQQLTTVIGFKAN
ncbi:hypothetical protein [Hymenobacter sp. GOD-10R]|nr:hypothetical protein [Hymenobacter sp. GOD-10R]WRQ31206.1 hypothetical protein SD425_13140 [Hymenobacter sp. GOD-10R]